MRMVMKTMFAAALVMAFCLIRPTTAYSDDAVIVVAGKSMDTVDKLAKDLGIDLPPFLTTGGIEQSLPFVGQGGLAPNKPIGIVMIGVPNTAPDKMLAFVLPVNPGKATIDMFKGFGGQVMEGHPDTVIVNGAALRRTADYLIFSPTPAVAVGVDTQAVVDAVSKGDAVLRIVIDGKAMREKTPDLVKQMLDGLAKESDKDEGARMVSSVAKHWIDTLNRVEVGLDVADHGAHVYLSASPVNLPEIANVNRPGMPASIIGRVDLGAPLSTLFPEIHGLMEKLLQSADKDLKVAGQPATDEQRKHFHATLNRLVALDTDAATKSIGFEVVDGKPVIYVVYHLGKEIDVLTEMKEGLDALKPFMKDDKDKDIEMKIEDADGGKVLHMAFKDNGVTHVTLDIMQRGADVYAAGGPGEGRHLAALLAAGNDGQMKAVLSSSVDLGKLVDGLATAPDSPVSHMPPEMKKELADLLKDQKVHTMVVKDGEGVKIQVKIEHTLLERIPKLTKLLGIGPKKQDGGL